MPLASIRRRIVAMEAMAMLAGVTEYAPFTSLEIESIARRVEAGSVGVGRMEAAGREQSRDRRRNNGRRLRGNDHDQAIYRCRFGGDLIEAATVGAQCEDTEW